MLRIEKTILAIAEKVNWIAAAAIAAMMLLTTLDIILRMFRYPIPGAYELVGLLGSVVISFSLAHTSVENGHIAVEFLVRRFSRTTQALTGACNALIGALLFAVIAWQSVVYGIDLFDKEIVSLTIQVPIYPFVFGVAAGCALLCPVLLVESLRAFRRYRSYADR